jgi:hypothetical protein
MIIWRKSLKIFRLPGFFLERFLKNFFFFEIKFEIVEYKS